LKRQGVVPRLLLELRTVLGRFAHAERSDDSDPVLTVGTTAQLSQRPAATDLDWIRVERFAR
jgi:hypothetical protein